MPQNRQRVKNAPEALIRKRCQTTQPEDIKRKLPVLRTTTTEQQPQKKETEMNVFTYERNQASIQNNGTTFFNPQVCTYEITYKVDGKVGMLLAKGANEETVRQDAIELFQKKGGKKIEVWTGQVYL